MALLAKAPDLCLLLVSLPLSRNSIIQYLKSNVYIDCKLTNVVIGVLTNKRSDAPPNIVLDNLYTSNVENIVMELSGEVYIAGSSGALTIPMWAIGKRYEGTSGKYDKGPVSDMPTKPASLMNGNGIFAKSRPQYESLGVGSFIVATDNGISNMGTGDQTAAINSFLQKAKGSGKIAYFPAGIYQVQGTVVVPVGSKLVGTSWSQVRGACAGRNLDEFED